MECGLDGLHGSTFARRPKRGPLFKQIRDFHQAGQIRNGPRRGVSSRGNQARLGKGASSRRDRKFLPAGVNDATRAYKKALELEPGNELYKIGDLAKAVNFEPKHDSEVRIEDAPMTRLIKLKDDYDAGRNTVDPLPPFSEARRFWGAMSSWQKGLEIARRIPDVTTSNEAPPIGADRNTSGAVENIANAMLHDLRGASFSSGDDVLIRNAILYEGRAWNANSPTDPPAETVERMKANLDHPEGAWNVARPRLAITVRSNIILGAMGLIGGLFGEAVVYLRRAIALIRLARSVLDPNDEHIAVRGTVLRETYLRGIQALLLHAMIEGYNKSQDKAAFPLDNVKRTANEILDSCEKSGNSDYFDGTTFDTTMFQCFYLAHLAEANMALGRVNFLSALANVSLDDDDRPTGIDYEAYRAAGNHYAQAATYLPPDDNMRGISLYLASEMYCRSGGIKIGLVWDLKCEAEKSAKASEPIWGPFTFTSKQLVDEVFKQLGITKAPDPELREMELPAVIVPTFARKGVPVRPKPRTEDEEMKVTHFIVTDDKLENALNDLKTDFVLLSNTRFSQIDKPSDEMVAPPEYVLGRD